MIHTQFKYLIEKFIISLTLLLFTPQVIISAPSDPLDNIEINYLEKKSTDDYLVGAGDSLRVVISRYLPQLTTIQMISPSGHIFLPKLGKVYISELTIDELEKLLEKKYSTYIKKTNIEISITNYRPVRVLIKGEVDTPGLINLTGSFNVRNNISKGELVGSDPKISIDVESKSNLLIESYFPTIFDAIQKSGGITNYSDLSKIIVTRKNSISNGGNYKTTTLNFLEFLNSNSKNNNIRVLDGDIIEVKRSPIELTKQLSQALQSNLNPNYIEVFVTGRVNIAGKTTVTRTASLSDAIDISGGAKYLRGPVTFIRFNKDGSVDKRKFRFTEKHLRGSYKNPYLKNGDIIRVGESALSTTASIINDFTSPIIGIYGTYKILNP